MIRVVLVDDHQVVREGTRRIFDQHGDIEVVGEAGDGEQGLALIKRLNPDVAIVDIRMPELSAIEVTRRVRAETPHTRVLILTAYDDDEFVAAVLEAGAQGYLLKTVKAEDLVQAVRTVHAGGMMLDPGVAGKMSEMLLRRGSEPEARPTMLTPRELEVLRLAAQGLRNWEIADRLGLSRRTVEGHFSSILGKMGLTSRTAAVMAASERGWLD